MKKSILIYYELDCSRAPRVHKQISALKEEFSITIATRSFKPTINHHAPIRVIELPANDSYINWHLGYPTLIRKSISLIYNSTQWIKSLFNGDLFTPKQLKPFWNSRYRSQFKLLKDETFDLVIGHHTKSLPLALALKKYKKCPVVINAHEYYPLEFEDNPKWIKEQKPLQDYLSHHLLPQVDGIFCVGNFIGEQFKSEFKVPKFTFVPNDKPFSQLSPTKVGDVIRIIHHGGAIRSRNIHLTIDMMKSLPSERYELHFMLMPTDEVYMQELIDRAEPFKNISFIPVVPFEKIIGFINDYDIGIFILPPVNFNSLYALPNKFYEFVQARLCLCNSPNPEIKALIDQYDLGKTSDDYSAESMASAILGLSKEQIMHHKEQSHRHAQELSSEETEKTIRTVVNSLIEKSCAE